MDILENKIKVYNFSVMREALAKTATYKTAVSKFLKYAQRSEKEFEDVLNRAIRARDDLHESIGITGMSEREILNDIVSDINTKPVNQKSEYIKKLKLSYGQINAEILANLGGIEHLRAA